MDGEKEKYQTELITTRSFWKNNLESNYTLEQSPDVGQIYFVFLKRPVRISLNLKFWLYYDCPKAFYDGYEKQEEIEQAKFCFGEITKIISHDESGATVAFAVLETLTLQDILKTKEMKELPAFLAESFIQSINNDDYSLKAIGKYFQLNVSLAQGDIGQFCIFTDYENIPTICLFGEWAVTEDWVFGGKYKLPDRIKAVIMTQS